MTDSRHWTQSLPVLARHTFHSSTDEASAGILPIVSIALDDSDMRELVSFVEGSSGDM